MDATGRPALACPICLHQNSLERRNGQFACGNCGAVWRIKRSRGPFRSRMVWAELVEPACDGRGKELVGQARPLRFGRRIALRGNQAPRAWPAGREKIIVKEIVKVHCRYCGNLFDITLNKCPSCGAPR